MDWEIFYKNYLFRNGVFDMKQFDEKRNTFFMCVLKALGTISNGIVVFLGVISIFYTLQKNYNQTTLFILFVLTVFFQASSLIIGHFYNECVERKSFNGQEKKRILEEMLQPKAYSNLDSRNELRMGLTILTSVFTLFCLYWAIVLKDSRMFIMGVCLISIAFIYADYIPHLIFYSKRYDEIMLKKENNTSPPNSTRALARIYSSEYFDENGKVCKFKKNKHKDYVLNGDDIEKGGECVKKCVKHILLSKADSVKNPEIYYGILILFINIISIIPNTIDTVIKDFLPLDSDLATKISPYGLIAFNIGFGIINIVSQYTYKEKCEEIKKIYESIKEPECLAECYSGISNEPGFKVIYARGIFEFNSEILDMGEDIDKYIRSKLPIEDNNNELLKKMKMLYSHRLYANLPRFRHTVVLSCIVLYCILLNLHCDFTSITIIFSIISILLILFRIFVLPNFGKIRIGKMCEMLKKNETKK